VRDMGSPLELPMIHCTPPTDPVFLAAARRAVQSASAMLDGELAVLVGTVVRIRELFPKASIITVASLTDDGHPYLLWLISRDGWTPIDPELAADPPRPHVVGVAPS
jgi:hypothetical protein